MNELRCWIAVASRDHVEAAVAGGYIEVNHGKAGPLERMRPGDRVAFYSPRTGAAQGEVLQAFTALGHVADAPLFQAAAAHQPFRRAVRWEGTSPAPVRPMLEHLEFVRNKRHWGAAFRFGYLRVGRDDFARIAAAMGRPLEEDATAIAAAHVQAAAGSPELRSSG
jgi:hypothetical protein